MAELLVQDASLTSVANAIREKSGGNEPIVFPEQFISVIQNLEVGGVNLNFEVVGNPQPDSPKENTIWVNTDTDITSWIFSATEPTEPVEGMVWFLTGTSSPVEFNALKKNGLQVYPMKASQYISGVWTEVAAKIYQSGSWKDLITDFVLYDRGTKSVTFTKSGDGSFTENSNYLLLKTDGTAEATFDLFAAEPIDLTHYKTLAMEYSNYSSGWVCSAMVMNGEDVEARANASSSQTSGTATVDISTITGERKLKIRLYSSSATARSVRILSWKLLAT